MAEQQLCQFLIYPGKGDIHDLEIDKSLALDNSISPRYRVLLIPCKAICMM